jgi:catechol 2,3-dioxygenase-like lactoylglutathione lyase family enzyme
MTEFGHTLRGHVAFLVDDDAFDAILRRLQSQGVAYGSQPNDPANGRIDHPLSKRGLFFQTLDGHLFELMASSSDGT